MIEDIKFLLEQLALRESGQDHVRIRQIADKYDLPRHDGTSGGDLPICEMTVDIIKRHPSRSLYGSTELDACHRAGELVSYIEKSNSSNYIMIEATEILEEASSAYKIKVLYYKI